MTRPGELKATGPGNLGFTRGPRSVLARSTSFELDRGRWAPASRTRPVKSSLADLQGSLNSWTFTNTSASHICNLEGVSCWNINENRIINLQLTMFKLFSGLPESKNCHSLQMLDLSQNKLDGPILMQIC